MDWLFNILLKILEGVLIVSLPLLLARLIPAKQTFKEIDFQEFIDNPRKESKWNWIFLAYMFLILPIIAFPISILFEKSHNFIENLFSDGEIVLYPPFLVFYFSSLLILYIFACKPSDFFLKAILKNRYEEYIKMIAYSEYKYGIDYKKSTNVVFIFLIIITVPMLFLQAKSQTYFYTDRVEFFDFPTWKNVTYHYKDVSKIIHTPGFFKETGGVDNNEHYRIYFNDTNHWSSLTWNDLNEDTINAIKLVSEKTKKIIEEIPGIKK